MKSTGSRALHISVFIVFSRQKALNLRRWGKEQGGESATPPVLALTSLICKQQISMNTFEKADVPSVHLQDDNPQLSS